MRASARSLIAILAVAWTGLTAPAAIAATFTVTTTIDASDASTADGLCDVDAGTPGQQCTLRAAIEQTNAQAGQDTVIVPAGTYTIQSGGVGATPPVTDALVIEGAGAATTILRQEVAGHVVRVGSTGSLDLRAVTVRDGVLAAQGAGIRNEGTLILRGVRVVGNQAFATDGGGVYASSTATGTRIFDSVIGAPGDPNVATSAGSSTAGGRGGGIAIQGGEVEIRRSLIEANEANDETTSNVNGGGIWIEYPNQPVTISETTIRGNKANEGNGGGLSYTDFGVATASLVIERSAITGNTADTCGGGLIVAGSTMTMTDSTVSGNNAGSNGGGICGGGDLTLSRSTVAANTVTTAFAPGLRWFSDTLTVSATILDNQNDDNCSIAGGSIVSGGSALDSGSTCAFPAAESNLDPLLGPLGDNGGSTATHALSVTSPAVDAAGACGGTDQRGAPRTGLCDIGAYERVLCEGVLVNKIGDASGGIIVGTEGADGILGFSGDEQIQGLGGDDAICPGAGNDIVDAGAGNDIVAGDDGDDVVDAGAGDDVVAGDDGDDVVRGGPGNDVLRAGPGADNVAGDDGNDRLAGDAGADIVVGGSGGDVVVGGPGKDTGLGGSGKDVVAGGPGKDRLKGQGGKDKVRGQGGNDRMSGGAGRDLCNGGGGKKDRAARSCEKIRRVP